MAEYNVIGNITVNFEVPESIEEVQSGEPLEIIIGKLVKKIDQVSSAVDWSNDLDLGGTLHLTKGTDISGTNNTEGALIIGPYTGDHMYFDGNEIMVKNSNNEVATININLDGGNVNLSSAGYNVNCKGTLIAQNASTTTAGLVKVDGTTIKINNGIISGVGIQKAGETYDSSYTIGYNNESTSVSGSWCWL